MVHSWWLWLSGLPDWERAGIFTALLGAATSISWGLLRVARWAVSALFQWVRDAVVARRDRRLVNWMRMTRTEQTSQASVLLFSVADMALHNRRSEASISASLLRRRGQDVERNESGRWYLLDRLPVSPPVASKKTPWR
jgi:hypothetical protein